MKNIDEHAVTAAGGRVLLDGDGVTKSGISIGGWTITSTEGHIATDAKAEQFKEELGILSIPEQWYASNSLDLEHEASGTQFSFQAEDALRAWRAHQLAAVHVAASEQWTHSRKSEMEAHHAKQLEYDWTFTTDYSGTVAGPNGKEEQHDSASWEATPDQMDRTLLTNRDPILFFEELLLYESELEDNGLSTLSVKIRVMPKCWYVLLRFFLRVDGVMVRLRETRLFCHFGSSTGEITNLGAEPGDGGGGGSGGEKKHAAMVVLREVKFQEGTFEELKKAGAPPEGPVYADGDTAAVALAAVAPIGLTKYVMEKLSL
ncbi:hypothetical protein Ndes2526B_g05314 [Nannochloris sp. 'desiccata']|nr:hypothetical protein KSW81_006328 [Chlorella desiccata (nom. nud.)]